MDSLEGIHQFLLALVSSRFVYVLCVFAAWFLLLIIYNAYVHTCIVLVLFLGEIPGYMPLNTLVRTCSFFVLLANSLLDL